MICGGADTQLIQIAHPMRDDERISRYFPPAGDLVSAAPSPRLFLCQHPSRLEVWKLGSADEDRPSFKEDQCVQMHPREEPSLVASLAFDDLTLRSSAISRCGTYIACVCNAKLWLLRLDAESEQLERIRTPFRGDQGFLAVAFSSSDKHSNEKKNNNKNNINDDDDDDDDTEDGPLLIVSSVQHRLQSYNVATQTLCDLASPAESSWAPILKLATSNSGKWLATADLNHRIAVYDLTGAGKSHASVPTLQTRHSSFVFHPTADQLYISTILGDLLVFDLHKQEFLQCSPEQSDAKPLSRSPIQGIAFAESSSDGFFLWSHEYALISKLAASQKISTTKKFNDWKHILFLSFLNDHEVVLFQRTWPSIRLHFPIPVNKRKFQH